jgi:hypothetical protein
MFQVDVENNRVLFCAEGIPLYEPLLLEDDHRKKKNAACGCLLLLVATFSTVAIILIFVMYPSDDGLDSLSSNDTNSTTFNFPFEVLDPSEWVSDGSSAQFKAMEWMKGQQIDFTAMLERFALATVFAATNGVQWKTSSFEFLNKDTSICEWNDGHSGVICDGNHSVKKLLLGE